MRGSRRLWAALSLLVLGTGSAAANPDTDPVVVQIGKAEIRVSDVERRLALLPKAQLRSLGDTPEKVRQRFMQSVLVPELLYGEAAKSRHLDSAPWVQRRIREVYHRAVRTSLTEEALAAKPITDDDIAAYYEEHRSEFHKEERLLLWRILVDDEELAKKILEKARGVGGPERWKELARKHSKDTATHLRAGMLGFVGEDGATDVPQVRVDPILYAEARNVRDGELVPKPVREGEHYAVVWRCGTRPATGRTVAEASEHIRGVLERKLTYEALTRLLTDLRKKNLTEHHPELLSKLPTPPAEALRPSGALAVPSATGSPSPAPPSASTAPAPTQHGDSLR